MSDGSTADPDAPCGLTFWGNDGRYHTASFNLGASALRGAFVEFAQQHTATPWENLSDQARNAVWNQAVALAELDGEPLPLSLGERCCISCFAQTGLRAAWGEYGEPLLLCESCAIQYQQARAALAREGGTIHGISYTTIPRH